ncbi:bifunctional DNA primase/polymerase [Streptomyces olivaceus]|uniref:bifunctional DNA primase/polymerase n=1 Tax=Streptomyces olivaceus TaxID=47716 RepID=UPI003820701C
MKYINPGGAESPGKDPEGPESTEAENGSQTAPDALLVNALALAASDIKVFPCHSVVDGECTCQDPECKSPGKHPRTWKAKDGAVKSKGSADATTDPEEIRGWWLRWGKHGTLNVGQTLAGRAVVDIDVAEGKPGEATWADLMATEYPDDPDTGIAECATLTYRTGRGGTQYVYRLPNGEQGGKQDGYGASLGVAVDFKTGPHAYVMVPGSKTVGVYTVIDDAETAPLPEWIAAKARSPRAAEGTHSGGGSSTGMTVEEVLQLHPDASERGNNALAQVAGHYARQYRDQRGLYLFHCAAWNDQSTDRINSADFTKTTESIWKTEQAKGSEAGSTAAAGTEEYARELESLTRKREMSLRADQDARRLLRRELEQETAVESLADAWQAILDGDEGDKPTVGELTDDDGGLFYMGKINGVFGDGGTGKSVALAEIQARTLNAGEAIVHWEFDNNSQRDILRRLHNAGADVGRAVKEGRIVVLRGAHELEDVAPEVVTGAALVTLDALTPAVSALGLDVNHPGGTDAAFATFMQPFTVHGAAGVFIDHVGHENKERQAGSIRKSQAVQGALYEIKSRQLPAVGQDGLAELILRKDNGPASRQKDRTAAFITYESLPDMRIRVTFSRDQDPEITDRLNEAEWEKRAATAEGKQEFIKELICRAIAERGAVSATEAHVWIQQAGYRGRVGSAAVKVAMTALVDEGAISVDASASGAGTAGGRPTDRYRALAPKPSGPHQPELGG